MMKNYPTLVFILLTSILFSQNRVVGINELEPQQTLHLGTSNGTIRLEGVDENNATYNNGGTNTYPLFVDEQGDMTLENEALYNSGSDDALNFANMNTVAATILAGDADGLAEVELFDFTITVQRPVVLLLKYNLSFEVFENGVEKKLTDRRARRVNSYWKLNNSARKYGHASKCYSGADLSSPAGIFYNMSSSYIILPAAGTYTLSLHGEVSSGLYLNNANTGLATCVKFGRGTDILMYKLY